MDTIFMNFRNSNASDSHKLLLNLTDKIEFRRKDILRYQILIFTAHRKKQKSNIRAIDLKYQLQHGVKNLNYLMDHILYQMFKIILNIYLKSMRKRQLILQ